MIFLSLKLVKTVCKVTLNKSFAQSPKWGFFIICIPQMDLRKKSPIPNISGGKEKRRGGVGFFFFTVSVRQ